jgi:hypothetical protein
MDNTLTRKTHRRARLKGSLAALAALVVVGPLWLAAEAVLYLDAGGGVGGLGATGPDPSYSSLQTFAGVGLDLAALFIIYRAGRHFYRRELLRSTTATWRRQR